MTRRSLHSSSLMVSQTLNMIGAHLGQDSVVFCLYLFWEPCGQINVKDIKPPLEQFCTPALELWRTPPLSPRSQFEHLMVDRGRKKCPSEILELVNNLLAFLLGLRSAFLLLFLFTNRPLNLESAI